MWHLQTALDPILGGTLEGPRDWAVAEVEEVAGTNRQLQKFVSILANRLLVNDPFSELVIC